MLLSSTSPPLYSGCYSRYGNGGVLLQGLVLSKLLVVRAIGRTGVLQATGVSIWCLTREQFGFGRSTISMFPQPLGVNLQDRKSVV